MNNKDDIVKVLRYIEENMRVTDQTSIEYLDAQGNIDRLSIKQNHIIFGRRGSGKSLLLKSLRQRSEFSCISVNMEDFKDISFPNSIIQVQKSILRQLLPVVKEVHSKCTLPYWIKATPLNRKLTKQIKTLDDQLIHPDEYDKSFKEKNRVSFMARGNVKLEEMSLSQVLKHLKRSKLQSKLKLISLIF